MPIQVFHMWWNKRGGTPYVGPPSDPVRKTLIPLVASCPCPEQRVLWLRALVDLQLIQRDLSHGSRFTERHHDRTGTLGPALARLCR